MLTVELFADRPDLVARVAELRFAEWGDEPGRTELSWWVETTTAEAGRESLPVGFVAVDDGEVLGGVALDVTDPPELADRTPWVVGTIVRRDRRGEGIGQVMLAELARWAVGHGITRAWVATGGRAVEFYQRCGWHVTETVPGEWGPITILAAEWPG